MSQEVALHAAFMMKGLLEADCDAVISSLNCNMGYIEVVSEMVKYAEFIESIVANLGDEQDFPGVLDYEVSSPFGKWFGKMIISNKQLPSVDEANSWIAAELIKFFGQSNQEPNGAKNGTSSH